MKGNKKGNIYITVLVTTTLFVSLAIAATTYVGSQAKLSSQKKYKAQSFQIAEAGIEYYRWHLAHAQTDYRDGTSSSGPYIHDVKNTDSVMIGQYSLDIIPPPNGSTVVNIRSTGHIEEKPTVTKTLKVSMGIPSFATYAVAANDIMRFGEGTEVFGPVHSNNGIRFDGLAHNIISSHVSTYTDPDSDRCTANSWGVHTCVNPSDPTPPTAFRTRNDIFMAGRVVGAPTVDFNGITSDLGSMQTAAQPPNGIYLGPSGAQGYHLTLKTDGKLDIKKINNELYCQYNGGGTGTCSTGTCSTGTCTTGSCSIGTCNRARCSNDSNNSCTANADCKSCSNNRNRSCTANSGCQSGGICNYNGDTCKYYCSNVGQCANVSNQSCNFGNCTNSSQCVNNGTCNFNSCTANNQCPNGGTCPRLTCTAGTDCASGVCNASTCSSDTDCSAGAVCSNYRDFGYCSNNLNSICYQDSSCGNGNTCIKSSHSIGTSAGSESSFTYQGSSSLNVNFPSNGLIFVEDDLWVDGAIDNARLTIVAARTPLASGNANIYLNKNLTYTPAGDTSGNDAIGLIAQNNVLLGYFSDDNLRIDAALIAQKGRIGRPFYGISSNNWHINPVGGPLNPSGGTTCSEYRMRNTITSKGAIATYQRYGFAWVGNMFTCPDGHTNQSGYCTRNLVYDDNFYFAPPPYFPTTGQYRIISWEEE